VNVLVGRRDPRKRRGGLVVTKAALKERLAIHVTPLVALNGKAISRLLPEFGGARPCGR
jgi:hypothetical protein